MKRPRANRADDVRQRLDHPPPCRQNRVRLVTNLKNVGVTAPVVVADADPSFRAFVAELVQRMSLSVVLATTGGEALRSALETRPVLVVLDVGLADVSGYELCTELRDRLGQELPIILVSGQKTDDLDRAAGMLLGADDYFVKPLDTTLFMARVRRLVARATAAAETADDGPRRFTPREQEILALLADGQDRAAIARALVISPRTVGSQIQHLLSKLGVHSQAQAVAAAYREGLIAPPRR
jgi:DNA-binding NarL/FixJ family response regulator